ncbi:hypothetical protein PYCC9005_004056 [Savitreella phatthalungensis]
MVHKPTKRLVDILLNGRQKNIPFLAASLFFLPLSITIVFLSYAISILTLGDRRRSRSGLTILVSGGRTCKALVHARQFARAGHRVILCEEADAQYCATRYSNCVDRFYTLPDPLASQQKYTEALLKIVLKERVDIFVPCCGVATTICDGIAKRSLDRHCTVLQFDEDLGRKLDKKDHFMAACQLHGLEIPKTVTFTSAAEVMQYDWANDGKRKYVMKCVGVDDRTRNDMTLFPYAPADKMLAHLNRLNMSKSNPYIMQEFLDGAEYCCQSIAWRGVIRTYSACLSSDVLMNYTHIPPSTKTFEGRISAKMLEFAQHFTKAMELSGPVAFDFLLTSTPPDGAQAKTLVLSSVLYDDSGRRWRLLPIECNPRTHTANTNFLGNRYYEAAYTRLAHDANTRHAWPILPDENTAPARGTYWIGHELFNLCLPFLSTKRTKPLEFINRILTQREAEWDLHDPLPFLMCYHFQWPFLWLTQGLIKGRRWTRMNASTGKVFWLD